MPAGYLNVHLASVARALAWGDAEVVPEPDEPPPMGFADLDAGASRSLIRSTGLLMGLLPAILLVLFAVAAIQGWGPL